MLPRPGCTCVLHRHVLLSSTGSVSSKGNNSICPKYIAGHRALSHKHRAAHIKILIGKKASRQRGSPQKEVILSPHRPPREVISKWTQPVALLERGQNQTNEKFSCFITALILVFWLREGHQQESVLEGQPKGNNPAVIGCCLLKGTFREGKTQEERLKEKMLCCTVDRKKILPFPLTCPHPQYHRFRKKSGKVKAAPPFSVTKDFSLLL